MLFVSANQLCDYDLICGKRPERSGIRWVIGSLNAYLLYAHLLYSAVHMILVCQHAEMCITNTAYNPADNADNSSEEMEEEEEEQEEDEEEEDNLDDEEEDNLDDEDEENLDEEEESSDREGGGEGGEGTEEEKVERLPQE